MIYYHLEFKNSFEGAGLALLRVFEYIQDVGAEAQVVICLQCKVSGVAFSLSLV